MRDHHRGAVERLGQRLAQPLLADQRLLAPALGQHGLAMARGAGLLAGRSWPRERPCRACAAAAPGWTRRDRRRSPARRSRPTAWCRRSARPQRQHLALQPGDAQALAGFAQARVGRVEVQVVVLVVARHVQHRHRPAVPGRKAFQPEVVARQQAARLVGADVAGQDQQVARPARVAAGSAGWTSRCRSDSSWIFTRPIVISSSRPTRGRTPFAPPPPPPGAARRGRCAGPGAGATANRRAPAAPRTAGRAAPARRPCR